VSSFLQELAQAPERDLAQLFGGFTPGMVVADRFELVREIGRGGFGVIYEALDRDLGRRVAFKVLRTGGRKGAGPDEALRREAEAAAQLNHPNIVTLHDVGTGPSGPYLVLELLRGETLQDRMQRGLVPLREAVRIGIEVAKALAHAHAAGVLHRDLKPSNVFLTEDGQVKVLDFGLARFLGAGTMLRGGTPAYMAPEQWRGEPEDERTDLFALGVVLYEMLTGSLPFPVMASRSAALDPEPAPPLPLPKAPRRLVALVASALEQDPAARPRNAQVFLDRLIHLDRFLAKVPSRRRALWISIGAVAMAVATAVAVALFALDRGPTGSEERVVVSVADVANDTGERDLDGLSGLLITSLEQSRRLAVLTRSRMIDVLRQLGREPSDRIDETLAREVGRQVHAKALLLASLHRFDRLYTLELRAVDPVADEYLFTLREEGRGKDSIPGMLDQLSEQARRKLRERKADVQASAIKVAQAVTTNLEAYQHYFVGLDCFDRPIRYPGYPEDCLAEFRKAIAIDPEFAMAHYQLSRARLADVSPTAADRAAIAAAVRYSDRVPPKERMLIRAWAAHVDGKDDEAVGLYRQIVTVYPDDKQALYLAGDLPWHLDHLQDAIPYLEHVLGLDPTFEHALDHLSYSLAILGRRRELAGWVRTWSAMAPTAEILHALVQGQLGLGDAPAAVAAARRGLKTGETWQAVRDLAHALVFAGDYTALEVELRRARNSSPLVGVWLADVVAMQGRRAEGLAILDALGKQDLGEEIEQGRQVLRAFYLTGDGDAEAVAAEALALLRVNPRRAANLAVPLAYLGDLTSAHEMAAHLRPGSLNDGLYRALVDWKQGRPAQARARLEILESQNPLPRSGIAPAFLRAEVAAEGGLDAEVVDALQRYQGLPLQGYWRSWAWPRSLFLLARSHERLGDRDRARKEIERLLQLWSHADAGLPLLGEAQALRSRLDVNYRGKARGRKSTTR
jgi:tetratricopeptide (TPR) repeat protein